MSDSDFPFRGDALSGSEGYGARGMVAEAQRLIDPPRPVDGYPLSWYVKAWHIGDLTTLAMATLREKGR